MRVVLTALLCLFSTPAFAMPYQVDFAKSELAFSGTNAGKPFRGVFGVWRANIDFDPEHLADSRINVTIETGSAKTGDATIDATLSLADWFDAPHFPEAKFLSSAIHKKDDGSYRAIGTLKIREVIQPVAFNFTLTPLGAGTQDVSAKAQLTLKRLDFGLGKSTDPQAKWVGDGVVLDITLLARPAAFRN